MTCSPGREAKPRGRQVPAAGSCSWVRRWRWCSGPLRATGLFLTRQELSPGALLSVPQGEGRISAGGAAGTGRLQGRGVLGSPGTRHPRADAEAVGRAGGGPGGISVSGRQCCWGQGRLVAGLGEAQRGWRRPGPSTLCPPSPARCSRAGPACWPKQPSCGSRTRSCACCWSSTSAPG